jgi:hypothetical protein
MRIKRCSRPYLLVLVALLIVWGCRGKDETQPAQAPGEVEQEQTIGKEAVPSSEKPEVVQEPANRNTPPRITQFNVAPRNAIVGDTVKAETETLDGEEDTVAVTYQWSRNDEPIEETSNTLVLKDHFKRGDKITVKATPDDGKVKGTSMTITMKIANASPAVKGEAEPFRLDGDLYTYQVKATDPDGDELMYALKEAPYGMTIDPKKGFIQWKVPPDFTGTSSHTVSVTDGHGGETTGTFVIEIQAKQIRR